METSFPNTSGPLHEETPSHLAFIGYVNQENVVTSSPLDELLKNFYLDARTPTFKWKPTNDIQVMKVFQNNCLQEVFRDASGVDHAAKRFSHLQLVTHQVVIMKKAKFKIRIKDQNGNQYRTLESYKARELTWKGKTLFTYNCAIFAARSGNLGLTGRM